MTRHADAAQPPIDVAIVGVQKGGTTALASFLGAHPRIASPSRKELHAFDNDRADWGDPDWDALVHAHFPDEAPGQLRLDATPITMYWPGAVERLARWCPDVRAIALLRHPTDRAWSHWRMERRRGMESLDFGDAIREGRARVAAAGGHHRVHSYVERGFYAGQVDRLLAHLPAEQVLLLRQDDLRTAHHDTLHRVHEFLGLTTTDLPPPRTVFSAPDDGPAMAPEDRAYLDALFAEDLHRLARDHGIDLRR